MELVNETQYATDMFRHALTDGQRMLAIVVAKATYVLRGNELVPNLEGACPVDANGIKTAWGDLPGDAVPWKVGVDFFLLGNVQAPVGRRLHNLRLSVELGAQQSRWVVFGDRFWLQGGMGFSAPRLIESVPLGWQSAFGGRARLANGREVPYAYNPVGKGFVLEPQLAEGVPLPNLESERELLQDYRQQPLPLCPAPLPPGSAITAHDMLEYDAKSSTLRSEDVRFKGLSFNQAHPAFRFQPASAGAPVKIVGVLGDEALNFALPRQQLSADVWLNDRKYQFPLRVDTVCVLSEPRTVIVVQRCHFTYSLKRGEVRIVRLTNSAGAVAQSLGR